MKFEFNWGTGIFAFYTVFVLTLIFVVYKSTQYDHSLVVEDYYAKDLAYQGRYDQMKNSAQLAEKLHIFYLAQSDQVQIRFPDGLGSEFDGEVLFYRADNKSKDALLPIQTDQEKDMLVDVTDFETGRWKVQVEWSAANKEYYDEKVLFIK